MKKMGAFEVKTHLSQILEEVKGGEEILITKRGTPIALIIPYDKPRPSQKSLIANFRRWRKKITWGKEGMSIKQAKSHGRK